MKRRILLSAILVTVMLIFVPTGSALPVSLTQTELQGVADAPSTWSVQGVGDATEAFVVLRLCWDDFPALNPFEGEIELTMEVSEDPDELALQIIDGNDPIYFSLPFASYNSDCTSRDYLRVVIEVVQEFEGTLVHTYEFAIHAQADGDIGTYEEPKAITLQMQIVAEMMG